MLLSNDMNFWIWVSKSLLCIYVYHGPPRTMTMNRKRYDRIRIKNLTLSFAATFSILTAISHAQPTENKDTTLKVATLLSSSVTYYFGIKPTAWKDATVVKRKQDIVKAIKKYTSAPHKYNFKFHESDQLGIIGFSLITLWYRDVKEILTEFEDIVSHRNQARPWCLSSRQFDVAAVQNRISMISTAGRR